MDVGEWKVADEHKALSGFCLDLRFYDGSESEIVSEGLETIEIIISDSDCNR